MRQPRDQRLRLHFLGARKRGLQGIGQRCVVLHNHSGGPGARELVIQFGAKRLTLVHQASIFHRVIAVQQIRVVIRELPQRVHGYQRLHRFLVHQKRDCARRRVVVHVAAAKRLNVEVQLRPGLPPKHEPAIVFREVYIVRQGIAVLRPYRV